MTREEAIEAYLDVIDEIMDEQRKVEPTPEARKRGRDAARVTLLAKGIDWNRVAAEFDVETFKMGVRAQWRRSLS